MAAHMIVKTALALARHLQAHNTPPALGLESGTIRGTFRHPAATVLKLTPGLLGSLPLRFHFFFGCIVPVGEALLENLSGRFLILGRFLRLIVRSIRSSHLSAFVPVQPEPAETVKNRCERFGDVALLVGIVDTQNVGATVFAGVKPVKESRAD